MNKTKIKPGDIFGYWTVLRLESEYYTNSHALCECKCGKQQTLDIYNLLRGKSTKCRACSNAEIRNKRQKNIHKISPGDQFGKWTIIKEIKEDGQNPGSVTKGFLCRCQCGNTGIIPRGNLTSGTSTQCKKCAGIQLSAKKKGTHYKKTDIVGKRYGQLLVIGRDAYPTFICKCDCGNTITTTKQQLECGKTDCGHVRKEYEANKRIGEKYGRLTIIRRAEDKICDNGRKMIMYICQCDCGNIVSVSNTNLLGHNTTSCGCYVKEKKRKNTFKSKYTPEMKQEIMDRNNSVQDLSDKYGVNIHTIYWMRRNLEKAAGIEPPRKWTKEMNELVLKRELPDKELAAQLGVTCTALQQHRRRLILGINY